MARARLLRARLLRARLLRSRLALLVVLASCVFSGAEEEGNSRASRVLQPPPGPGPGPGPPGPPLPPPPQPLVAAGAFALLGPRGAQRTGGAAAATIILVLIAAVLLAVTCIRARPARFEEAAAALRVQLQRDADTRLEGLKQQYHQPHVQEVRVQQQAEALHGPVMLALHGPVVLAQQRPVAGDFPAAAQSQFAAEAQRLRELMHAQQAQAYSGLAAPGGFAPPQSQAFGAPPPSGYSVPPQAQLVYSTPPGAPGFYAPPLQASPQLGLEPPSPQPPQRADLARLSSMSPHVVAVASLNAFCWLVGLIALYAPWSYSITLAPPLEAYFVEWSLVGGTLQSYDLRMVNGVSQYVYSTAGLREFYSGYDAANADSGAVTFALIVGHLTVHILSVLGVVQALLLHREIRRKVTWITKGVRRADCCIRADHAGCPSCLCGPGCCGPGCCCCDGCPDHCDTGPEACCGPWAAFANARVMLWVQALQLVSWLAVICAGIVPGTWAGAPLSTDGPGLQCASINLFFTGLTTVLAGVVVERFLGAAGEAPPPGMLLAAPPGAPPPSMALADVAVGGLATTGGFGGGPLSALPPPQQLPDLYGASRGAVLPASASAALPPQQLQQLQQLQAMQQQASFLAWQSHAQAQAQAMARAQGQESGLSPAQEAELTARRRFASGGAPPGGPGAAGAFRRADVVAASALTAQQQELLQLRMNAATASFGSQSPAAQRQSSAAHQQQSPAQDRAGFAPVQSGQLALPSPPPAPPAPPPVPVVATRPRGRWL